MKMAKSYKFLILIMAFVLSLACGLGFMNYNKVSAAAPSPSAYFTGVHSVEYKNDQMVATMAEDTTLKLDNKVIVDDLGIKLVVPAEAKELIVKLTANSFDPNGNMLVKNAGQTDEEIVFDKEIVTEYKIKSTGEVLLHFSVENNFICVQEGTNAKEQIYTDGYHKVENVDKTPVKVEFYLKDIDDASSKDLIEVALVYINQKQSEGETSKYNQTFVLTDDKITNAWPRAVIDKGFFSNTESGYILKKVAGENYTLTLSSYAVYDSSSLYLTAGDEDVDDLGKGNSISFPVAESNSKKIVFDLKQGADTCKMTFNVATKVAGEEQNIETYLVDVYSRFEHLYTNDPPTTIAPVYKDPALVESQIESFNTALNKATLVEKEETDPNTGVTTKWTHSINLGKTITIPSLESFVLDNITSYTKFSKTYHYVTPLSEDKTTTSSTSIPLDRAGWYSFYVTFTDENGNAMDSNVFYDVKTDTYRVKEDDGFRDLDLSNPDDITIKTDAGYAIYIFSFFIEDNAPLSVLAQEQGAGFVGVKYIATEFIITASGFNTNYSLYYSSNLNEAEDSNNWKEIIPVKKASTNGANGYTFEELKAIAYDGQTTFVPNKIGSYKIECVVTSEKSHRSETDTAFIRIASEPTIVKPANYWLQENVVPVIFLSVGTLCLIAILVLLFIKPKDKAEDED